MPRYQDTILHIISESTDHLSAEQVFLKLKEQYPRVVQATVYNNLNTLCSSGKIRRITTSGGPDLYDRAKPHDHLQCTVCGKLSDVVLPDLSAQLEQLIQSPVSGYDLKISWVCPACSEKQRENPQEEASGNEGNRLL